MLLVPAFGRAGHVIRAVSRLSTGDTVGTFAGTGAPGFFGDGGGAAAAQFAYPFGVYRNTLSSADHLYVADTGNHRVRRVDMATGVITTIAGDGTFGYAGDGGSPGTAKLAYPRGVVADPSGTIYVADTVNHAIRRIAAGLITTVAGNGFSGYGGDGGPAPASKLSYPFGVWRKQTSSADLLYIADTGNHRVRRVDLSTGTITTVAGTGVAGYSGDGAAPGGAQLNSPRGVVEDASGTIFIADTMNHAVRRIAAGVITTVAGTGIAGFSGDGGPALSAQLNSPGGLVVRRHSSGDILFIADTANHRVRQVNLQTGTITSVVGNGTDGYAGDGGAPLSAQLSGPRGVTEKTDVFGSTSVYIADTGPPQPPQLNAGLVFTPSPFGKNQPFSVVLTVTNTGSFAANLSPTLSLTGGPVAAYLSGPLPASATLTLPPNGVLAYTWQYQSGAASGTMVFSATITALNTMDLTLVSGIASRSASITEVRLDRVFRSHPNPVPIGLRFLAVLSVTNAGTGQANAVTALLSVQPDWAGSLRVDGGPHPASVASLVAGAAVTFTWTCTAFQSAPPLSYSPFSYQLDALDAATGLPLTYFPWDPGGLLEIVGIGSGQFAAAVAADPPVPTAGRPFVLRVTVTNTGLVAAEADPPAVGGHAAGRSLVLLSGPSPAGAATLAPGAAATFTYTFSATGGGDTRISVTVTGRNAGTTYALTATVAATLHIKHPAEDNVERGEMLAAPNVLDLGNPAARVVLTMKGDPGGRTEVDIYDESGRLLGTVPVTLDSTGSGAAVVEGLEVAGRKLATGVYWAAAHGGGVNARRPFAVVRKKP